MATAEVRKEDVEPSPRGSYAVGRKRKQQIIDIALERFSQRGYYGTSMAGIASDVGLSEGGLLHHFPSKKHLLLAVAQRRLDADAEWWSSLPGDAFGLDVFGEMIAATEHHVEEPGLIELFVIVSSEAADTDSPAHELFANRYKNAVETVAARLRLGVERDGFEPSLDYEEIARECIAISDGLQLQWVLSDGRMDLVAGVRRHLERLAQSIVAKPSAERNAS